MFREVVRPSVGRSGTRVAGIMSLVPRSMLSRGRRELVLWSDKQELTTSRRPHWSSGLSGEMTSTDKLIKVELAALNRQANEEAQQLVDSDV